MTISRPSAVPNPQVGDPVPSVEQAVAASVECARLVGLPTGDPRIVAEGYSVRVHLHPAPVLTRVVTLGRVLRGDPLPWLQPEVAVANFLSARGAPVVPPWEHPGPYVVNGLVVSLWTWVEHEAVAVGQTQFGQLVRDLHGALESFAGEVPPLVGPLTDISSARELSDDPVLHAAAEVLVPLALSWPRRPLHGDAHTGNLLRTAAGWRWIDLEDVCCGPIEWDLASRTVTDAAVHAYGSGVNAERLQACRDLRRLQILAGILTDDLQDAALYEELTAALRARC